LDPREFCTQTRLVIVAGKGGVGKTTISAALAQMAAQAGLSVLVVEMEGKHGLAAAFGAPPLSYDHQELAPGVSARTLTPDLALLEYLDEHGLKRISKRLTRTGTVDVVATAAPGIKDILVLGKVKQLEQRGEADLIILDAPAAGHALSFLMSARALVDVVRSGVVRAQAEGVLELLTDARRAQVLLVTIPEETPVNEAVETAEALRSKVGMSIAGLVVNGLYPMLDGLDADPEKVADAQGVGLFDGEADVLRAAATFRQRRQELQQEQMARLAEALDLPQIVLPAIFAVDLGLADLDTLAAALADGVAALPAPPASPPPPSPGTKPTLTFRTSW
jgi:anion-transporting  ArsA/GET3 family ATPase